MTSAPMQPDGLVTEVERAERMVQAAVDGAPTATDAQAGYRHALLERCAGIFRLTAVETDIVLLALAVEVSPAMGAQFARLNGDAARRRPTVASLLSVLATTSREPPSLALLSPGGHLVRTGLIELTGDGPFPDRIVRIPDVFWPRLAGLPARTPFAISAPTPSALAHLVVQPRTREQIAAVVTRAQAADGHHGVIFVVGRAGTGRDALAAAIAAELGFAALSLPVAAVEDASALPHIAREVAWNLSALIVTGMPSPGTLARVARETSTPIVIITDDAATSDGTALGTRWRIDVEVEPLDAANRERLWREQLSGASLAHDVDLPALAARIPIGPGRIVDAAATARRFAHQRPVRMDDLRRACRRGTAAPLTGLAQRIESDASFDELVVPAQTRRELELALVWARRSARVFSADGAGRRMRGRDGLVCLFHGPPGTGKTMAARVVASTIEADLLRIDLSQVVNKYIGETEKNLERVFVEAESTGSVLFFDEADALFGKRSDVKDAHDRYANIETAYLLQRLEAHRGVCILASNLRQNLDEAFTRRIHVSAEFPLPEREERRRIWELQLPPESLADDVDLTMLAERAALAGGDIRNAAATAALLAAENGGTVTMHHLVIGTWRELRKSGRLMSADAFGPWKDAILDYMRVEIR